ncbi:DUF5362 family protein [Thalassobellus citreus]|uniref:DUF5362 family protein n=1 Tax=Thalassobellus citreus TaxID=3367752 RepID=UPI00378E8BEB
MEERSVFESFELEVNNEIRGYLKEIIKWSYLLSVIGFIGIGLLVLIGVGISFYTGLNKFGDNSAYGLGYSVGVGIFYVLFALIYLFPLLYLFKFSKKMKSALSSNNNNDFKMAFLNLKSHYKFIAVFVIVILSLYLLVFIGVLANSTLF